MNVHTVTYYIDNFKKVNRNPLFFYRYSKKIYSFFGPIPSKIPLFPDFCLFPAYLQANHSKSRKLSK